MVKVLWCRLYVCSSIDAFRLDEKKKVCVFDFSPGLTQTLRPLKLLLNSGKISFIFDTISYFPILPM